MTRASTCSADVRLAFTEALAARSLEASELIADGEWHRCDATNVRNGRNDGAYKLIMDGARPWGLLRNWTDGQTVSFWHGEPTRPLTEAEQRELERRMEEQRADYERVAIEKAAEARDKARTMWAAAQPAPDDHPYLERKRIKPHDVRVTEGGDLIVPLYAPEPGENEPVSLQFIEPDGSKWYLRGGRTAGCFFRLLPSDPTANSVVEVEGFATGAAINEAQDCYVAVAFSAGNLAAVATMIRNELRRADTSVWQERDAVDAANDRRAERRQAPLSEQMKLVIAADDDWQSKGNPGLIAAIAAARRAQAFVAVPDFGKKRKPEQTDFADLLHVKRDLAEGHKYIREDLAQAAAPSVVLENALRADPHVAFEKAIYLELMAWRQHDRPFYERLLSGLKSLKKHNIRVGEIDRLVKEAQAQAARRSAVAPAEETPPPDVEALARSARRLIDCEDVLRVFAEHFADYIAGETANAKLLYLVCSSRLLATPMHAVVKGSSAAGKSLLRKRLLHYFPAEDIIEFTALSEKALLYLPESESLQHKILSMGEAIGSEEQKFQDYLLRELMSNGKLTYKVPQKQEDNTIQTVTIIKQGPVAFLVTTTRNSLHPENETRMLSLEADESEAQTRRILHQVADLEGLRHGGDSEDEAFAEWQDYQRWLGAEERRVLIPFSKRLARLIRRTPAVRLRRDFGQLLRAIKAHALLHRDHRRRSRQGAIVATIAEDYASVRELMADLMASAAELKLRKVIKDVIGVVARSQAGVSVRQVADTLNIGTSTAGRHLRDAATKGLIHNTAERKNSPARYEVSDRAAYDDTNTEILPTTEELAEAYAAYVEEQNSGRSRGRNERQRVSR
jgi:phage/plasmid primase-like uncharacterized protein